MSRVFFGCLLIMMIVACGQRRDIPDVSKVVVNLELQRFEKDFFEMDTTDVGASMQQLHQKYPTFLQDFAFNILGLPAQPDSNVAVENGVKLFISSYADLKDTADKIFKDLQPTHQQIHKGLQFVKYYFPNYPLPSKIITFIGPLNSFGNILTSDALAVGLQLYMGKNFSWYQSEAGQQLYPAYISRKFEPSYIPVNCMKNIIDDMYPNNSAGRPLVEQMVEAGKRLYLLDRLLPETPDTLKTGYTAQQLKSSFDNETGVWSLFLNNDLLYVADPAITKDYMNEAPNTPALGPGSPGFIGQFVGWQIVKKWMEKNENSSLRQLMDTPPKTIFEQAKYKPR